MAVPIHAGRPPGGPITLQKPRRLRRTLLPFCALPARSLGFLAAAVGRRRQNQEDYHTCSATICLTTPLHSGLRTVLLSWSFICILRKHAQQLFCADPHSPVLNSSCYFSIVKHDLWWIYSRHGLPGPSGRIVPVGPNGRRCRRSRALGYCRQHQLLGGT